MSGKIKLSLFSVVLTFALALYGSVVALEGVSLVTVITVFAGAFGAGAGLTSLMHTIKKERKSRSSTY